MDNLTKSQNDSLDAATFRRFLKHLDNNKDVQNIDLMILANFCRNCLSKWYKDEAEKMGIIINEDQARERIYGMSYSNWKTQFQKSATDQQMKAYALRKKE